VGVLPVPDEANERNGHSDRSVKSPMIQPVAAPLRRLRDLRGGQGRGEPALFK
jgi:hypothetical protein